MFSRTVLHFHAGGISELYTRLPRPARVLFRRAYFHADAAIRTTELAPGDPAALEARREYVIPYGVDDDAALSPIRAAASSRRELRILFAAVLRESKGLFVFLEAVGELVRRGLPVRAELMGQFQSDAVESQARRLVERLEIGEHVRFLGVLSGDEKHAAFLAADLFCLPTFFASESFPLAIIDAMSFGLPVVATRWRGIPALVEEGRSGFLVNPRDAAALAHRLARLVADPGLRLQMAAAGRARFVREYRSDTYRRRMGSLFRELSDGLGAVRPRLRPAGSESGVS